MVGSPLQIDAVGQLLNDDGFCRPGAPTKKPPMFIWLFENVQGLLSQSFKTASHTGPGDVDLLEPLLS